MVSGFGLHSHLETVPLRLSSIFFSFILFLVITGRLFCGIWLVASPYSSLLLVIFSLILLLLARRLQASVSGIDKGFLFFPLHVTHCFIQVHLCCLPRSDPSLTVYFTCAFVVTPSSHHTPFLI